MDDLDERCKKAELKSGILQDLNWLGLDWDGDVEFQSKRVELYERAWNALKSTNLLYPCFCSRADLHVATAPHASDKPQIYLGKCRLLTDEEIKEKAKIKNPSWRIKVPEEEISFEDEIFGYITQNLANDCGDFVLKRSDNVFSYHFCNCVDDLEMGVTQVVRGCDLLTCTPQQIWLKKILAQTVSDMFFNETFVSYHHLPLIKNLSGQRLAKRDASLTLEAMRNQGVSPKKIIGKIAQLIGVTEKCEEVTAEEFAEAFEASILKNKADFVIEPNLFE